MVSIVENGIVVVADGGETRIVRPGKRGGAPTIIAVPTELADEFRLATGDIVEGDAASLLVDHLEAPDCQLLGIEEEVDLQYDEPTNASSAFMLAGPSQTLLLTSVQRVNGYEAANADDRPFAKSKRSVSERTRPDRLLKLAVGERDVTGRMIDFAAPLGCGDFGVIAGPHHSGRTRTLRAVLEGVTLNAPDCVVIVMLIQSRGEEVTDFRRRFPQADIVICPTASFEISAAEAIQIPMLIIEAAQRQTEMGRDVVILIDSLTALWGMMLDIEGAGDQRGADISQARQRIRDYVQKSGCFHGLAPLGGSLGGSLTIVGTVWSQEVDEDAEEDRETHPHLRLLEQITSDLSWRVTLDAGLASNRFYPAIDVKKCLSRSEDGLLDPDLLEIVLQARGGLPRNEPGACYVRMMDALEVSGDLTSLCEAM